MTLEPQKQQQQQQQGRDLCPFLSPEEEEDLNARSVLCLVEVEEQCGSQGCLDTNLYIEDCIEVEAETDDNYSPCIVVDIVQEDSQTPRWVGNHHGNMNGDDLLENMQKIFQRQPSLKREKVALEKASDSFNNKWRKYRRAASFDSRKVVIVFSVMSSLGTLILIYLTLRVKLNADGYAHTS